MAIALVASVVATPGSNGGATSAITTTGATLLVVSVASYQSGTLSASDSKGNSWTALTLQLNVNARQQIFYALNPASVGTGHTFTVSGSGIYPTIFAYAFSGVGSYQIESGATVASGTSLASGSVTPSADGALILVGVGTEATPPTGVTPVGFTLVTQVLGASVNRPGAAAWQVQTPAAAINPTWAFSANQGQIAASTAVFLADGGAAGGGTGGAGVAWWLQQMGGDSTP